MDRITFKNFRKFKDKTTFDLQNINILVGTNNSGKSTLTKGLRLYMRNLIDLQVNHENIFKHRPFFQFGGGVLDNTHIGTFGRAISKDADDDYICFSAHIMNLDIETIISRYSVHSMKSDGSLVDYYEMTNAPITKIIIYNNDLDARFTFDFEKESQIAEFNVKGNLDYYTNWAEELSRLERKDNKASDDELSDGEIIRRHYNISRLKKNIEFGLRKYAKWTGKLSVYINEDGSISSNKLFLTIIKDIANFMHSHSDAIEEDGNKIEWSNGLLHYTHHIARETARMLEIYLFYFNHNSIQNIEAHSVTRSVIYNISDKNDYMAQTISDYLNENIKEDDPEKIFIEDWMMKFEIGEDFIIESIGGECYKLDIIEDVDNPDEKTALLDKGVGNNQIMILLLRLATIMRKNRGKLIPCTVIIEEPEQNLHPRLQSLLADLFFEVYQYPKKNNEKSIGITFIIETHSEYLVRKSQVIVRKELNGEENPFAVFYLENNCSPRIIQYQESGSFSDSFGEGFYDEAIKLTEEIV